MTAAGTGGRGGWLNLGLSGARLQDALDRQLPILDDLVERGHPPAEVVCCVGTNDLVWGRDVSRLSTKLTSLVRDLPPRSVVGALSGGSARGRLANRALRTVAEERDLRLVDTWSEPNPGAGSRLASDRFHPNDLGYLLMARPFGRALGVERFLAPLPNEVPTSEVSDE